MADPSSMAPGMRPNFHLPPRSSTRAQHPPAAPPHQPQAQHARASDSGPPTTSLRRARGRVAPRSALASGELASLYL
jgi:hypothetical protein